MILIWCVPTLLLTLLVSFPEKANWDRTNFPWIYHDTTPIKGKLDKVMAGMGESAVNRATKRQCVHITKNRLKETSI